MFMIKLTLRIVDAFTEASNGPIAGPRQPEAIGSRANSDPEAHSSYLALDADCAAPATAHPGVTDPSSRRVA